MLRQQLLQLQMLPNAEKTVNLDFRNLKVHG